MSRPDARSGGFNSILRQSIHEGIVSVVGRDTAKSVEFYLDSSIAAKDIVTYTKALERIFDVGSKRIEENCARALYSNLGLNFEVKELYKLSDYVNEARKRFLLGEK